MQGSMVQGLQEVAPWEFYPRLLAVAAFAGVWGCHCSHCYLRAQTGDLQGLAQARAPRWSQPGPKVPGSPTVAQRCLP